MKTSLKYPVNYIRKNYNAVVFKDVFSLRERKIRCFTLLLKANDGGVHGVLAVISAVSHVSDPEVPESDYKYADVSCYVKAENAVHCKNKNLSKV